MKESTHLWSLLRQRGRLPGTVDRLENVAGTGMPDVSGTYNGHDYWIELKILKTKKEIEDPINAMRPSQVAWTALRVRHGSCIFLCGREEKTGAINLYIAVRGESQPMRYDPVIRIEEPFPWETFTKIVSKTIDHISAMNYLIIDRNEER